MKSLSHRKITEWLVSIGALSETENSNGKPIKSPTEEGEKLGISVDFRHGMYGDDKVHYFSQKENRDKKIDMSLHFW